MTAISNWIPQLGRIVSRLKEVLLAHRLLSMVLLVLLVVGICLLAMRRIRRQKEQRLSQLIRKQKRQIYHDKFYFRLTRTFTNLYNPSLGSISIVILLVVC